MFVRSIRSLIVNGRTNVLLVIRRSLISNFVCQNGASLVPLRLLAIRSVLRSFLLLLTIYRCVWNVTLGLVVFGDLNRGVRVLIRRQLQYRVGDSRDLIVTLNDRRVLLLPNGVALELLARFGARILGRHVLGV